MDYLYSVTNGHWFQVIYPLVDTCYFFSSYSTFIFSARLPSSADICFAVICRLRLHEKPIFYL